MSTTNDEFLREIALLNEKHAAERAALLQRHADIKCAAVQAFREQNLSASGTKKTIGDFIECMKQKKRIVIVMDDPLAVLVLNDPTVATKRSKYGSGYTFEYDEEGRFEAYSAYNMDFVSGTADWFATEDDSLRGVCGYTPIQHIEYPAQQQANSTDK